MARTEQVIGQGSLEGCSLLVYGGIDTCGVVFYAI